jgi:hypothetical protein
MLEGVDKKRVALLYLAPRYLVTAQIKPADGPIRED